MMAMLYHTVLPWVLCPLWIVLLVIAVKGLIGRR
jgi:hypothetical protein